MEEKLQERVDTVSNGEKQQAFLLKLSDALRALDNPLDIEEAATKIALDFLVADRCHYGIIEGDNVSILREAVRGDLPSVVGVYSIGSFALYQAALKEGVPFVVADMLTNNVIEDDLKKLCLQFQYGSFINVPVIKNGKPVGLLALVQNKARKWTDSEVQIVVETAERTWAAVERAKAEEALRKSEEKYRTLLTSIDQGFTLCELIRNKEGKGIDLYILEVNPTYEKQTGITKEMVIGKPLLQVFPSLHEWMETYAAVVDNQRPVAFEQYFEDTARWFAIKAYPVGKERFAVLFSDITERRQAEERIKESEKRFRTMADASPVLIWTIDADGFSSYYNKTFRDFIGVSKSDDISDWKKIVHPDDVKYTFDTINTAIAARRPYSLECRLLRADGQWRWVLANGNPSIGANSEFLGFIGSSVDITERKQAEENIIRSERRFHELIYSSPSMVAILRGEDMIIEIANSAIITSWGKGKDVTGKSIFLVLPELVEQGFDQLLLNVYKTGQHFHTYETPVNLLRDGMNEKIYYNFVYQAQRNVDGEVEGVAILANEVTPQALLNKKIKASEQRYHALFMQSPFAFSIMIGKDMKVTHANDLMKEFWGKGKNVEGKTLLEILPELGNQPFPAMIDSVYTTGEPVYANETVAKIYRNGIMEDRYFNIVYEPHFEADDTVSGVITIAHDVTQHVLSRKNIEESETLFKLALSLTAQTVFKQDTQLRYTWIYNTHPKFVEKEVMGKMDTELLDKDAAEILTIIKQSVLNTGKTFTGDIQFEMDGQPVVFAARIEATKDISGKINGILAVTDDITERKQIENNIKESEQEIRKIKEQLELSIRAGKIGIWHWDVKNDSLYWSKEQKAIYGLESSAELLNVAQYEALVIPEDWERLNKDLQSAPIAEEQEYDFRIIRKNDGEIRWIKSRARNIVDEQGALQFISGVNIDITEEVLALNKIQASEEKFKRLVLQAPVAICVLRGEDYVIETMNEGMCAFWDRTLDQALNRPVFDVLPEVRDQGVKEILDNVYFTGKRCVIQELSVDIMRNGKLENAFVKFVYEPLRETDGTISGVMALAHEITEQVGARKRVEESEKKFEAAILAVEGIIWTNNAKGEMIGEQPGWAYLTGQKLEEYQGYGWTNAIHPDDAQPTVDAWNQAVATNSTFEFEHRVKSAQNEWRLFSVKAVPAFDKNGILQQWVGVHTDITEQKHAQEKLAYRGALLEAHNEASVDGILLVDAKGKMLSFNQRFIEIWNMPPHIVNLKDDEAALSFAMSKLVYPQQFIDKVKYLYDHPTETCHDELEFKDGRIVERNGYPVVGEGGIYYAWSWTFKDITERKEIEQDLKNAKEQLELTFKNIPAGVYLLNEKGEMIYVNDKGAAVYGDFTPDDLLAEKNLPELLKIADELFERFDENGNYFGPQNSPAYISLNTGLPSQAVLKQINKVTTETRWHYVQGAPLFKEDGKVSMVLVTSTDITVQKIAEQKMRESEERFRLLSDEMPQFVWTGDADGHLTYFNEAVYKYSGLTEKDVANDAWIQIVHPDDRNDNIRLWTQSIATGKDFIFEHRFRRADGEYRWQLSRAVPQRDTQGVIRQWIGTSTDIHDKKSIEEKLEKLVAERTRELQRSNDDLQQFAHVASHDLKEPVRKVKTFTSRLEQHLDGRLDETGTRFIERIHVATDRMFNMIEGVLAYSTTNASMQIPQLVDLTEVVKSVETDLELALQKTGATLTYNNLPILEGAPVLLYQLFVNLISNSIKFVKSDQLPRIKISSEDIFEDDKWFVSITLQDNGIGFDPELAEQIFGSFVRLNSKDKYEGTGLGLSLCKKIVDRHGGSITANGMPNEGATFVIILPVNQTKTSI